MANDIPFSRELDFDYGVIQQVAPMIRRVVARNPSAFTLHGTGTYVIGVSTAPSIGGFGRPAWTTLVASRRKRC